jgi:phospholipid transport system substrate-binding protein
MIRSVLWMGLLPLASVLAVGTAAAAPPAGDSAAEVALRKTVDDVFTVLKDKSLAGKGLRARRIAALRQIADQSFDWAEMARSSLGVAWRKLNPQERARFVEVFKDVLAAEYMDDIDRFRGTEVVTVEGSTREGEDSVVRTTLVTSSRERVAMDYRVRKRAAGGAAGYSIVDVSIEGVSLVNHFRKTFANALGNMSIGELTDRLRQQLPKAAPPASDVR